MEYIININQFEGPFDLLLHLIKQNDISICEIRIDEIINQYLNYINEMEELNLNIASEYLVMAAELIEIKSLTLLPNYKNENEEEEDPCVNLINRLYLYKQYKEMAEELKNLEDNRRLSHSKEMSDLRPFVSNDIIEEPMDIGIDDLVSAFNLCLERIEEEKPLNTKITKVGYSVSKRSLEIKTILNLKKKVEFLELFEEYNKDYIIVTFLSILELSKEQYLSIIQEQNFQKIYLTIRK